MAGQVLAVNANRTAVGPWESFTIIIQQFHPVSRVSLRRTFEGLHRAFRERTSLLPSAG